MCPVRVFADKTQQQPREEMQPVDRVEIEVSLLDAARFWHVKTRQPAALARETLACAAGWHCHMRTMRYGPSNDLAATGAGGLGGCFSGYEA